MLFARITHWFCVLLATAAVAQAQSFAQERATQRGNLYLGGDFGAGLGFKANSLSYIDATTLADGNVSGRFGVFPVKKALVGVYYHAAGAKAIFDAYRSYLLSSQSFGGFARYYLKGGLFGEASYSWGRGTEKETTGQLPLIRKFNTKQYALGLGIGHFWGKHLSLELLCRYSNASGQFEDQRPLFLSGFGITAGAAYIIGKQRY